MIKEAIILSGGLGTRLQSVVKEIPKPMAPIREKPFLEYLFLYLKKFGIKRVILSTGYKHEVISDFFGNKYYGMEVVYAIENEPLGTGGGILNAIDHLISNKSLLLNGDTFFNINLEELIKFHVNQGCAITLTLKKMFDFDRYGSVEVLQNRVVSFVPKMYCKEGLINGGVYVLNVDIFQEFNLPRKFSFENDFLNVYAQKIKMGAFVSDGYFIDIGIPQDYEKAINELGVQINVS